MKKKNKFRKEELSFDEKWELIKRNTVEIVGEEEFKEFLSNKKEISVYCGYEPSGPMHLGHFATILKLMDLNRAGIKVKILLADLHAFLNHKGDQKEISREVLRWKKIIKAVGFSNAEIILGSNFQFTKEYQLDVLKLAQKVTIQRGIRGMQEISRGGESSTISQLLYPLMQVADIKHLNSEVALGGLEQRKVHMVGKDLSLILNHNFIAIHTPLITSLKGPGQKMSKSLPGSGISVVDDYEEIKKTINGAYCPEGEINENPLLQICKLILFPKFKNLEIKRPVKFGGNILLKDYFELEKIYSEKKVHPLDLKLCVIEYLEKLISPIRKNYLK